MRKPLVVLGVTGNIGTQALDLLRVSEEWELVAVSAGRNVSRLREILSEFKSIKMAAILSNVDAARLSDEFPHVPFFFGEDGSSNLVSNAPSDAYVLNSMVGFSGLRPSLTSVERGMNLLLANKESLVVGGNLVRKTANETGSKIIPIDSEHVALAKCLASVQKDEIDHFVITASGGPFYGKSRLDLTKVGVNDALAHPTWSMGKKITIDSATMVNKGFELVEASYLFDIDPHDIEVRVDRHSRVHSALYLKDGTYVAEAGPSDMHRAINYALSLGKDLSGVERVKKLEELSDGFKPFDKAECEGISLVLKAYELGGSRLASLNAANEEAISLFLEGKISFLSIFEACRLSLDYPDYGNSSYLALHQADREARELTRKAFLN